MADKDGAEHFHAESRAEWRAWLGDHHASSTGVWLVTWRTPTGRPRLTYEEAVLEALAVGWIDGHTKTLDDERGMQ